MYRVIIVDDHESVCDSLSLALHETEAFKVIGTLSNAEYALAYCEKLSPDLILLDVCTEAGASGLEAAQLIRSEFPNIKIIVMSGFEEITYSDRAKAAGADAFVLKSKSLDFFQQTALGVMKGETYFPQAKKIPMPLGEAPLTEREMEVLRLICKHMSSREIADALFISENTVKYHKANMLAKTGFSKTVELAFYMLSNGWINPFF